jgi:hypothetical protein
MLSDMTENKYNKMADIDAFKTFNELKRKKEDKKKVRFSKIEELMNNNVCNNHEKESNNKVDTYNSRKIKSSKNFMGDNNEQVNDSNEQRQTNSRQKTQSKSIFGEWGSTICLCLILVLLGLTIWKWRIAFTVLTWPFHMVNALMTSIVTITEPAPGLFTGLMSTFGFMKVPTIGVTVVKATFSSVFLGILANVLYVGAFCALIKVLYDWLYSTN